jgi:DNA (cytosine-5)-methyltransferase 1
LMGFPDPIVTRDAAAKAESYDEPIQAFVIPVSDTQAYRQFGNAVVVDVIEHLGWALVEQADLMPSKTASEEPVATATG